MVWTLLILAGIGVFVITGVVALAWKRARAQGD